MKSHVLYNFICRKMSQQEIHRDKEELSSCLGLKERMLGVVVSDDGSRDFFQRVKDLLEPMIR